MNIATIICHYYPKPLGGRGIRCEWRGPRHLPVEITRRAIDELDAGNTGGWPALVEIDGLRLRHLKGSEWDNQNFLRQSALYVLINSSLATWLWWTANRRVRRILRFVYERLILTLHVWNLADHAPNQRPSWRDIRLFKRR